MAAMSTSSYHELVTIQVGHYSNHVGTHWWNLQEAGIWYPPCTGNEQDEIHSDCTFREGLTLTGKETYTPRLVSLDLSGSLSTLKQEGSLYEEGGSNENEIWKGQTEELVTEPHEKNKFITDLEDIDKGDINEDNVCRNNYDLESSVKVWSDFLRPHLHPKSLMTVPGFFHDDDHFNTWPSGIDMWSNRQFRIDMEDRLHFFVEECDNLQGFQLLFDQHHGGFSALSISLNEFLCDEYTNKPIVTFGVTPTQHSPVKNSSIDYTLNSLLTLPPLHEYTSLYVPLSLSPTLWPTSTLPPVIPPPLNLLPHLDYHTSAILSSAIEIATSCYRSPLYHETLSSICALLCKNGRKIATLHSSVPVYDVSSPADGGGSMLSLSPHCGYHDSESSPVMVWDQCVGIRGYKSVSCVSASSEDAYSKLIHQIYDMYPSTNSQLSLFSKPLIVNSPFPNVAPFQKQVKSYQTVTGLTYLQSQSKIYTFFNHFMTHVEKSNGVPIPSCYLSSLDRDTHQELLYSSKDLLDIYCVGSPVECSSDEEN